MTLKASIHEGFRGFAGTTQEQNTDEGHERLVRFASAFICKTALRSSGMRHVVFQWGDLHLRTLQGWQVLHFTFESAKLNQNLRFKLN
jgi:hypothetical protein